MAVLFFVMYSIQIKKYAGSNNVYSVDIVNECFIAMLPLKGICGIVARVK